MGGQSPSEYHIRYGILAVDLYAVAPGRADCGLWIVDCGFNGEATTNHPQMTQMDADNAGETANGMLTQIRKGAEG